MGNKSDSEIVYTVTAAIPSAAVADEYRAWLHEHVLGLIEGGAISAEIIELDRTDVTSETRIQSRYLFPSRQAFETYEREYAPALRADGLARFGPDTGKNVIFDRSIGELLTRVGGS